MILLSQWYSPSDPTRLRELSTVRESNSKSGLFRECEYVDGETRRWTYGAMMSFAADSFAGQVCVVANTDILFDSTILKAEEMCDEKRVVALTRWESASSPRMLGHSAGERFFSGSQDVWAFVAGRTPLPDAIHRIPLGVSGCENAFLGELVRAGCGVINPAIDIRTRHVHAGEPNQCVGSVGGYYAYPELTTAEGEGLVLAHDWPAADGGRVTMEVIQTWQR